MGVLGVKRSPLYGKLGSETMRGPLRTLWYTKYEDPEPVEYYQLCDREWQTMDQVDAKLDNKAIFDMLLNKMTQREQFVIVMRFVEEMTLEEVGQMYGVTRERVRQIEYKAMRKCRYWLRVNEAFEKAMREHRERMKEEV